jgi:hypothetical protein
MKVINLHITSGSRSLDDLNKSYLALPTALTYKDSKSAGQTLQYIFNSATHFLDTMLWTTTRTLQNLKLEIIRCYDEHC